MNSRLIHPPKFLHDIHGSSTSMFDLLLSYGGGAIASLCVFIMQYNSALQLPTWKLIILLLISADLGAGVVANFTQGTNAHYSGAQNKSKRLLFIFSHFIHPALFFFSLNLFSIKSVGIVFFVILSTLVINSIHSYERQKVAASFLLIVGFCLMYIIGISNALLLWFFPIYMFKLFIAFAIRRYNNE